MVKQLKLRPKQKGQQLKLRLKQSWRRPKQRLKRPKLRPMQKVKLRLQATGKACARTGAKRQRKDGEAVGDAPISQ